MNLKELKRAARRVGSRLGLTSAAKRNDLASATGVEMPGFYYDDAFTKDANFQVPFYKSPYYPTWTVVVDRLRRYGCQHLLDVGCGPGQFAALIHDSGFQSYTGIDFSNVAVQMARQRTPHFRFHTGDVRLPATYEGFDCDAVICMEVLEHIEDDFAVLSCFPAGSRCLLTVPNFPWRSHVRHFKSEQAVLVRYGEFFTDFSVTRLKGVRMETDQFYLMDGIRNSITPGTSAASQLP
jgi:SAM-dependent methyltransferase